ncbi:MAG: DUF5011 domain-containing protein [Bacteroidetes bacterium]|nr:DUF5011 domain-containing protein [Bacteroidota bacterium]
MKKQLTLIASVAFLAGVISMSSCKKADTTAPVITVTGGNDQTASLGTSWTNPTATATDDQDGDISTSITVTGTVDPNTKGTYTLTYSVSDAAGNKADQAVVIHIVNDAEMYTGNYSVHDTVPTIPAFNYNITITTDNTVNGKIHFAHYSAALVGFADYQNNDNVYATISGSTVTLPLQNENPIGTDNSSHDFSGNGTVTQTSAPIMFNITYTDHDITNSTTANGCVQTYTHF